MFGTGSGDIPRADIEKFRIWNESPGFSAFSECRTSRFACSIGLPLIEPEQSSTNTISFGVTSAGAGRAAGTIISVRKPPSPAEACVSRPVATRCGSTSHSSTKSLFGMESSGDSRTIAFEASICVVTTWCDFDRRPRNGTPADSFTASATSCPDRSPGRSTGGVIRSASGTDCGTPGSGVTDPSGAQDAPGT